MKRAILVGSRGQDGRILFDRMRREGTHVVGLHSHGVESAPAADVPDAELSDAASIERLLECFQPDEVYYLAAFHHPAEHKLVNDADLFARSFAVHLQGILNFLEAIRCKSPHTRLFYAGSARVFGARAMVPQDESTPFDPDCIYGISKAAGMRSVRYYRERHSLFAVSGILYNHESSYRPAGFVSQKIVHGAMAIRRGNQAKLILGDLSATVDWGYAPDYVDAMVRMLAMASPQDFIIATGEPHTVAEFAEIVFDRLGMKWDNHVEAQPSLIAHPRRTLVGNPARLAPQPAGNRLLRFHK